MDKKIFYLGFYDIIENRKDWRGVCLAATNKMTYILSALERAGYTVNMVSAATTLGKKTVEEKTVRVGEKSSLVLFKTLPWGNKIRRAISALYTRKRLKDYIRKNVGENDTLLVYHSVAYARMLVRLKKKYKFKLVLEVEEIYSDINQREEDRQKEYGIFEAADAFLFSTELLNEKINTKGKPHCVIYGTYMVEERRNYKFDDDKIHVIYAGTFDPRKGGLQATLAAAPYLDSNYHVHILTSCNKEEKKWLTEELERIAPNCKCKLTYEGYLNGERYIKFLQSCQIGLSTQRPEGAYNNTSFPSKVLSYLANGLRVVSIRIPVLERAKISSLVSFYDKHGGEEIANAIMKIDTSTECNSREEISKLDAEFVNDLKSVLEK